MNKVKEEDYKKLSVDDIDNLLQDKTLNVEVSERSLILGESNPIKESSSNSLILLDIDEKVEPSKFARENKNEIASRLTRGLRR